MSDRSKPDTKQDRNERLKQALRANLRRRKTQSKAKKAIEKPEKSGCK